MPAPRFMITLSLLGPVRVCADGRDVPLTVRKTAAVLAGLALSGRLGRVRLSGWLWPDLDEATARRNLRRELMRLRDAGLGPALQAEGDWLALAADVRCDVPAFEAACAAADADTAMALWRGPLADGLLIDDAGAFNDWLDSQRQRLAGLRRDTLMRVAERAEARAENPNELRTALRLVDALLADDPVQEHLHRSAMRLHAALGEREAAMARFETCRQLLESELGLQPMAETQGLFEHLRAGPAAARRRDVGRVGDQEAAARQPVLLATRPGALPGRRPAPPATDGPPRPRPTLPPRPARIPWVARPPEWAALEQAWATVSLTVLQGEGGAGKSRLAAEFASAQGPYAALRCQAIDAQVPYAVAARLLRTVLAAGGRITSSWAAAQARRLLPELGPAPEAPADEAARLRFLDGTVCAWRELAGDNFAAVVVDDLHLADPASLQWLAYLAQNPPDDGPPGPRLLATARIGEWSPAAQATLDAMTQHGHVRVLPLAGLRADELGLLAQALQAGLDGAAVARLHRSTGGNAFFAIEMLRHRPGAASAPAGALPAGVRQAVRERLQHAGPEVTRLLEAASLAHEPFNAQRLADTTALADFEQVAAFEAAEAAQLLVADAAGGFRFAHDLVREAVAWGLSPSRRQLLEGRLASRAEELRLGPAVIAGHWERAQQPARAAPWLLAAARAARAVYADAEARALLVRVLATAGDAACWVAAHSGLAELARRANDADTARIEADAALALARREGPPTLRVDTELEHAELLIELRQHHPALQALDALEATHPALSASQRHRLQLLQGAGLIAAGELDLAQARVAPLLASGEAADPLKACAHDMLALALLRRGQVDAGLVHVRAALPLHEHLGSDSGRVRCHQRLGTAALRAGDDATGLHQLALARTVARRSGDIDGERSVIASLMKWHSLRGEAQAMLNLGLEAQALAPRYALPQREQTILEGLTHAQTHLGQLGDALDNAERIAALAAASGAPDQRQQAALALAALMAAVGDMPAARALIDRARGPDATALRLHNVSLALAETVLECRHGDPQRGRDALARLGSDPAATVAEMNDPEQGDELCLARAQCALTEGQPVAALQHLDRLSRPDSAANAPALALRLDAQRLGGCVDAALVQQVADRLAAEPTAIPVLTALEWLRAAIAATTAAAARSGQAATRARLQSLRALRTEAVAASLARRPAARAGFLAEQARSERRA